MMKQLTPSGPLLGDLSRFMFALSLGTLEKALPKLHVQENLRNILGVALVKAV